MAGALVAATGIGASIVGFVTFQNQQRDNAADRLAATGQELSFVTKDIESLAVQQALGIRGLFESSVVVTKDEFDHFSAVTSGDYPTQFGFAPRVPSSMLDDFVANARLEQPDYEIRSAAGRDGDSMSPSFRWPLLYASIQPGEAGFDAGFDLASDPVIASAIGFAQARHSPVVSGFVALPGDEEEGDVVLIASVGTSENPLGVALVTLQLDELLTERASQLTEGDIQATIEEGVATSVSTGNEWRTSVSIAGRWFGLTVQAADVPSTRIPLIPLSASVLLSLLLGWFAYRARKDRDLRVRIARLQKTLAEKDRFLATVSHELRTPLTSVVGALEIMADPELTMPGHELEILVRDARDSARDLERLVEDHLTAGRLMAGALTVKRERVDLDEIVTRVIASVNLPPQIEVVAHPLGSAAGDPLRVRQVVRNVLTNAGRYAATQIEILGSVQGNQLTVTIRNDGEPVPPEIVDQLFVPFVGDGSRTRPESIGIGLAVSRDLARRMDGDLTYAYDGHYVAFKVTLSIVVDHELDSDGPAHSTTRFART